MALQKAGYYNCRREDLGALQSILKRLKNEDILRERAFPYLKKEGGMRSLSRYLATVLRETRMPPF